MAASFLGTPRADRTLESLLSLCGSLGGQVIDSLAPVDEFGDGLIVALDAAAKLRHQL